MKRIAALLALSAFAFAAPAQAASQPLVIDSEHTNVVFSVSHLGYSHMYGNFLGTTGTIDFDQAHPELSKVDVTIKPSNVSTVSSKLNEHLQGEQWFNTAKFPDIRFTSTSAKKISDTDGEVAGNLTLLGVTKPVTLKVHFNKGDHHPMTHEYVAGFSATTTIRRSDFGMGAYIPMVGDEVAITIETEAVNKANKSTEAQTNKN